MGKRLLMDNKHYGKIFNTFVKRKSSPPKPPSLEKRLADTYGAHKSLKAELQSRWRNADDFRSKVRNVANYGGAFVAGAGFGSWATEFWWPRETEVIKGKEN